MNDQDKAKKTRRDAGRSRGEHVVETLIKHTLEELAEHGPAQLSIERIAKGAELNKTSIYRRYPTKEALIAAAMETVLDGLTVQLPDTGSLRADTVALMEVVARFMEGQAGRALMRAVSGTNAAPELIELAQRRITQQAASPVAASVLRAIERGEWRPDVSPLILLSTLVGAILHRLLLEQQPATTEWIAQVVDLILYGVTPR
jgi:AcrR family transcriptional regulator